MKKLFLMIYVGLLAFLLIGTSIFAATDTSYYPLEVGNRWEYRITINGSPTSIIQMIGVISVKNGEARLGFVRNGFAMAEVCYTQNKSGIFKTKQITAFGTTNYQPAQPLVTSNMSVGTGWNWEADDKTKKESVKVVSTEKVTVPAGTFDALVLNYEGVEGKEDYTEKTWFVKGIGYVKNIQVDKKQTVITELIKYEVK